MLTLMFDLPGGKLTLRGRLLEKHLLNSDTLPLFPRMPPQLPSSVAEAVCTPEYLQGHKDSFSGKERNRKKKKPFDSGICLFSCSV